jgi:hypothetical protein
MRGYIYDQAQGLNSLRNEFDPELMKSFKNWQHATLNFIKPLLASIENLNVYTHNKDVSKKKKEKIVRTEPFEQSQYDDEFLANFQKNLFTSQCFENSEELQVRAHHSNTYFRAGVLKPLMIPQSPNLSKIVNYSGSPMSPTSPASTFSDSDFINSWFSTDELSDSPYMTPNHSERLYNRGRRDSSDNPFHFDVKSRVKKGLAEQFNSIDLNSNGSGTSSEGQDGSVVDLNGIVECTDKLNEMYENEGHKIIYLIREISKLQLVDDFAVAINMIIFSIKVGKYGKLADIVGEFKILVQHVKSMMKNADDNKKCSLKAFVNAVESVLNRKAFE